MIAIIGLLSSIVLASLSSARQKAKNTAYLAELKQLITALKLYREDNGSYPPPPSDYYTNTTGSWTTSLVTALEGNYIPGIPIHPDNDPGTYFTHILINNTPGATYSFNCGSDNTSKSQIDSEGIDGIILSPNIPGAEEGLQACNDSGYCYSFTGTGSPYGSFDCISF